MFNCPAKAQVQIKMFKFVEIRVSYKDSAIEIITIKSLLSFLLFDFYVIMRFPSCWDPSIKSSKMLGRGNQETDKRVEINLFLCQNSF